MPSPPALIRPSPLPKRAIPNVATVALISRRERALVPLRALVLLEGRFAVAECGAQVVAAGVSVWSFADEAVDPS